MHLSIGRLAEQAGQQDTAVRAYRDAVEAPDDVPTTEVPITQLARRAADQLESARDWIRSHPEEIASALSKALRNRNSGGLSELASLTHFRIGVVGSELQYVPTDKALDLLSQDLTVVCC